ncbi:MAG: pyrophosphate--fructose-6-phosphate 1-phosphotransferase [Candidatus Marinimicrobia bacterium]|nr:pyrophosphate--fructose-6-phosphate 1-phosphotransferase [Candidatus Neomarinimicrobiota bacterium]
MKIAFLTAGGLAPCLSASIGRLVEQYYLKFPDSKMIGYLNGYKGLLMGNSINFTEQVKINSKVLYNFGGSPIGNSRVKLTNIDDCINNGYIKRGELPLEIAAKQLVDDEVDILHTIGGDDTNTTAADLAKYLEENNYNLTVVGLPKTVDNDVYPIKQTLGAWTAAEQGASFFRNIANENTTNSRSLIIHEVMGRNCGWLTAATALEYKKILDAETFLPEILIERERWDIDAIYIPEIELNIEKEVSRLRMMLDKKGSVNIFLSEGAGLKSITSEMESRGEKVNKDAFGHVRLDEINPGKWFAKQFSQRIDAEKTLVQKSGYYARSAKPCEKDLKLIFKSADLALKSAVKNQSGVVGIDEQNDNDLRCIEFERIKGGKPFNPEVGWFQEMLVEIGQLSKNKN